MTDTQSNIVAPNPCHRWWALPLTVLAFAVIVIVGVASLAPASLFADKNADTTGESTEPVATPYAITPGGAQSVDDRIALDDLPDDVEVYPSARDVYFVTISEPAQSLLSWFVAGDEDEPGWFPGGNEPAISWLTEYEKYGGQSPQEQRQQSLQQMATSEDVAKYIALSTAGYDAKLMPLGVEVDELVCLERGDAGDCARPAPSAKVLEPGDVIAKADGRTVKSLDDLSAALRSKQVGDRVELTIRRDDRTRNVTVELIADPEDRNRPIIGFLPHVPFDIELPFELDIDTGQIGGPSAGAAFALTLIDELTAGDLLGDGDVAVTGTMSVNGRVGAIGGLSQKVEAVRQAGVDTFLVPAAQSDSELADAREVAGGEVDVIPVATLDEALKVLERRGGDPMEPVS